MLSIEQVRVHTAQCIQRYVLMAAQCIGISASSFLLSNGALSQLENLLVAPRCTVVSALIYTNRSQTVTGTVTCHV
jgi:uncharacterized protein (DUF1330 family)